MTIGQLIFTQGSCPPTLPQQCHLLSMTVHYYPHHLSLPTIVHPCPYLQSIPIVPPSLPPGGLATVLSYPLPQETAMLSAMVVIPLDVT
jgi:hypothetical protein